MTLGNNKSLLKLRDPQIIVSYFQGIMQNHNLMKSMEIDEKFEKKNKPWTVYGCS